MKQTVKIEKKQAKLIAHRGVSGLERENTCAAFVAAGNRSYFGIETDVRVTADGQFLIHHDSNLTRLLGIDCFVEDKEAAWLRSLQMKDLEGNVRGDLIMPTLEEYLRICKYYGKIAVLELKREYAPENIPKLVEAIRQSGWLEHTVFISFYLNNLIRLRQLLPGHPIQYLTEEWNDQVAAQLEAYDLDLDISYKALTKETVALLHSQGKVVNAWTVDDPEIAAKLMEMGVDYITSNILE